jgi:hypothetical protein
MQKFEREKEKERQYLERQDRLEKYKQDSVKSKEINSFYDDLDSHSEELGKLEDKILNEKQKMAKAEIDKGYNTEQLEKIYGSKISKLEEDLTKKKSKKINIYKKLFNRQPDIKIDFAKGIKGDILKGAIVNTNEDKKILAKKVFDEFVKMTGSKLTSEELRVIMTK